MNVKEIREKLIKFDDCTEVLTICRHCGNGYSGNIAFEVNDFTKQNYGYIQIEMNSGVEQPLMFERKVSVDKKLLNDMIYDLEYFSLTCDDDIEISEKLIKKLKDLIGGPEERTIFDNERRLTRKNKEFLDLEVKLSKADNEITKKSISLRMEAVKLELKQIEDELDENYRNANEILWERKYNK